LLKPRLRPQLQPPLHRVPHSLKFLRRARHSPSLVKIRSVSPDHVPAYCNSSSWTSAANRSLESRSSSHPFRVRITPLPDSSPNLEMDTLISSCRQIPYTVSALLKAGHPSQIFPRPHAKTRTAQRISAVYCLHFNSPKIDLQPNPFSFVISDIKTRSNE
jgi:hypothetical protein